ncbi:MAG: hypothetical protein K6B28_10400 [Lachnospiraceae bacterium]|nr:hypothetical protein [Lachnospiraceae bacterium]
MTDNTELKTKIKKKTKLTSVAVVTAVSMIIGSVFGSPSDVLIKDDVYNKTAIVQMVENEDLQEDDEEGTDDKKKNGLKERIRALIYKIPLGVRVFVLVPLWCLGTFMLAGLTSVWSVALSPLLSSILHWIVAALFIFLIFVMTVKAVFPDMPIKQILNKRNIKYLLSGTVAIAIIDLLLPFAVKDYDKFRMAVRFSFGLILLLAYTFFFVKDRIRIKEPLQK